MPDVICAGREEGRGRKADSSWDTDPALDSRWLRITALPPLTNALILYADASCITSQGPALIPRYILRLILCTNVVRMLASDRPGSQAYRGAAGTAWLAGTRWRTVSSAPPSREAGTPAAGCLWTASGELRVSTWRRMPRSIPHVYTFSYVYKKNCVITVLLIGVTFHGRHLPPDRPQ